MNHNLFNFRFAAVSPLLQSEGGQSFAEYAVIVGLVVLVAAAAFAQVGESLSIYITNAVSAFVALL